MLTKHMPLRELVWKLPVRIMMDWMAALKFLFQPSPADAIAVLKAHLYYFAHIFSEFSKRRWLNKKLQSFSTTVSRYPHFIVVDYFLLRNRVFKQLRSPK
jgi:hypothetical protein